MSNTSNQYYATFCVNLLSLGYGLSTGWTSAAIPFIQSSENPLKCEITSFDVSLIGSILTVGGLVGTLFFGYSASEIGKKKTIILIAFPQIIGWILMYFAESAVLLILFRFLAGISAGGIFTVVPVYISEISEDRVRGRLGSTIVLFFGFGLLLSYIFGAIFPYFLIPWISIPFSVIFLIGFCNVPETPLYLLKMGKYDEAEKALKYYRGTQRNAFDDNTDTKIEFESLLSTLNVSGSSNFSFRDLKTKHAQKALFFGVTLMALNQFCGCFAMLNFTATIFKESGSTLSPNISSIIVGAISIVGAFICTFLVEKAGRKSLLSISAFGISFGLAVLTLHTYAISRGVNLNSFGFVPLAAFSFVIFTSNIGILTLPFVYVSEIVPTNIKEFTMMLCLSLLYIFATIVIQYLSTLIELLGMHGTMMFFSLNSLIGAVFIVSFLPETKGKSYEDICKLMG